MEKGIAYNVDYIQYVTLAYQDSRDTVARIRQTLSGESVQWDFADGVCKICRIESAYSEPLPNGHRLVDFERGSFGHFGSELLSEAGHLVSEDRRLVATAFPELLWPLEFRARSPLLGVASTWVERLRDTVTQEML